MLFVLSPITSDHFTTSLIKYHVITHRITSNQITSSLIHSHHSLHSPRLTLSAPERRGRIQKEDLSAFIARTCRSFGVLLTLLERDLLKGVIQAYRKLRYIAHALLLMIVLFEISLPCCLLQNIVNLISLTLLYYTSLSYASLTS
jgi:hypothetical protein